MRSPRPKWHLPHLSHFQRKAPLLQTERTGQWLVDYAVVAVSAVDDELRHAATAIRDA